MPANLRLERVAGEAHLLTADGFPVRYRGHAPLLQRHRPFLHSPSPPWTALCTGVGPLLHCSAES